MQSPDYEAYAVSSLRAATNARFDSLHGQRAPLTPPAPVRSSRQNARSSRQPFGFRLDLRRDVPLRIPPPTPCSIAPLHFPQPKSRPKLNVSAHLRRRKNQTEANRRNSDGVKMNFLQNSCQGLIWIAPAMNRVNGQGDCSRFAHWRK